MADAAVSAAARPFTPQGVTLDDAFDLTPELKAAALERVEEVPLGPLYTPPSVQGTFVRPGVIGGANWGGGAFDPETGFLYVKTSHSPAVIRIVAPDRTAANPRGGGGRRLHREQRRRDVVPAAKRRRRAADREAAVRRARCHQPQHGLDRLARAVRRHAVDPQSRGAAGRRAASALGVAGAPGVIVTKGGLVLGGGADNALYAFDKTTGQEIWRAELPRRSTGTPMTYRTRSGRQFVVMATGAGNNAALVAWVRGKMTPGVVLRKQNSPEVICYSGKKLD